MLSNTLTFSYSYLQILILSDTYTFRYLYFQIRILSDPHTFRYLYFQARRSSTKDSLSNLRTNIRRYCIYLYPRNTVTINCVFHCVEYSHQGLCK